MYSNLKYSKKIKIFIHIHNHTPQTIFLKTIHTNT